METMRELSLFSGAGGVLLSGVSNAIILNMIKHVKCKICGEIFSSYNPNPTYCSNSCKGEGLRHPVDDQIVSKLYLSGLTKAEVSAQLGIGRKVVENSLKRSKTKCRIAAKRNQWGNKNHMWKGDQAGYSSLHKRLHRKFGKENKCYVCGTTDPNKTYDYANLTGNYSDENDYKRMCRSCHWKYDEKILNIKKMRQGGKKNVGE